MNERIGYCGLDCAACDAYLATIHDDQALREKTAMLWAQLNQAPILPEHINCLGCLPRGRGQDGGLRAHVRHPPVCPEKRCGYLRRLPGAGQLPHCGGGSSKQPGCEEEFGRSGAAREFHLTNRRPYPWDGFSATGWRWP